MTFAALLLLAEEAAPGQPSGLGGFLVMILPAFVVMMLLSHFMGPNPRKQQQQLIDAIKSLKKDDRVVSIGGIHGTFVSVSEDGSKVVIKVADNLRLTFNASAIRPVPPDAPSQPAKS